MEMDREGNSILYRLLLRYSDIRRSALEVGCGDGIMAAEIKRKFELECECIDPYGYSRDGGITIFKKKAEDIDLLARRYDIIYTIRAFHHIDSVDHFLSGLKKSLAFNGIFVIVDWKDGFDTGVPELYYNLLQVRKKLEQSGFEILDDGEGKSVFYIVARYDFHKICFAMKEGKITSLDRTSVLKFADKKSMKMINIGDENDISVLFSTAFGEREKEFNERGIKVYMSSGNVEKDMNFLDKVGKNKRCVWQSVCPVYFRYKRGEIPSYWVDNFCFVGNKSCVRYIMEERGEYHSDYMLPNGEICR